MSYHAITRFDHVVGDEEPNSPYNPYQDQNGAWGAAYKGRIIPGLCVSVCVFVCSSAVPSFHSGSNFIMASKDGSSEVI